MGQKVNPNGFRLGITKDWDCRWFDATSSMRERIKGDHIVRNYIFARLKRYKPGISKIVIERTIKNIHLHIHTSRPGVVVGRNGEEVGAISQEIAKITGKDVKIDVVEIRKPEIHGQLIADTIASQLEGRIAFKRSVKHAMQQAERGGCLGIKVQVAGRLGGIEIARTEHYKWGKVPLHTLRANIDYAESTAFTVTGTVGVKVWVYKGEIIARKIEALEEEEKQKMKDRRTNLPKGRNRPNQNNVRRGRNREERGN